MVAIVLWVAASAGLMACNVPATAETPVNGSTVHPGAQANPPEKRAEPVETSTSSQQSSPPGLPQRLSTCLGQKLYVPAYSHIYQGEGKPFLLAITLSIRNTSPTDAIVVTAADYYDSAGKPLKSLTGRGAASQGLVLGPLASQDFFIPERDTAGGSGASFVVSWKASNRAVTSPVVEALMVSTRSQQGISFTTSSRVLEEFRAE